MKVNEIVREERLDEVLPALAVGGFVVAWPTVFSAISYGMAAWGAIEVYNLLKENNFDPDAMSDEEWSDLFVSVALMFVPGAKSLGKAALAKYMPDSMKEYGVKFLKWTFNKKLPPDARAKLKAELRATKSEREKILKKGPPTKRDIKELNKLAKQDKRSRAAAQAAMQGLNPIAKQAIELAGVGVVGFEYWETLKYLESQYNLEISAPGTSAIYAQANGDKEKAAAMFREDADKAVGELLFKVTALIKPGLGAKFFKGLGKGINTIFGWWLPGGKVVGGASRLLGQLLQWLAKPGAVQGATRVSALVWLETAQGKEFLANGIVASILGFSGASARAIAEKMASLVDNFTGTTVASTAVSGATAGNIRPSAPGQSSQLEKQYNTNSTPRDLYVTFSPTNPKLISIGGIKMTDNQGFLLPGTEQYVTNLSSLAKRLGYPDPIQTLNLKPR